MRASCRKDDSGYTPKTLDLVVLVDDIDVTNRCFTADEESGEAFCYTYNKEGKFFLDPENPDEIKTEIMRGKVEIKKRSSYSRLKSG